MAKFQQILFLFINCLFVAKYTSRLGVHPLVFIVIYILLALTVWWLFTKKKDRIISANAKTLYFLTLSFVILGILLLNYTIDPMKLQVDRWSAIHNFIHNLFNGVYPYAAHTHLGGYGSPFPVWQVFHIPFYLLGNVGLGMLFSVVFLSVFLIWLFKDYYIALVAIVLLAISPAFWYEVAVRSDLIYNFIFCFIAVAFIHKKKYSIQNQALGLGLMCGLFLSTRFSIVIPFAIYLLPDFIRSDIKQKLVFGIVTILIFIISFLPFIFWNYNTFLFSEYNPFILQTRQGTLLEVLIIAFLGIYLSTKWKENISNCYSYISITLIVLVSVTFIHRMISDNFNNGLFDSAYDITYFNMALPFIIFSLATNDFFLFLTKLKSVDNKTDNLSKSKDLNENA
ncbi:MAG TPA: hypothetical protein VIK86_07205 [Candidatus Paceibacterota bacterium]